MYNKRKVFYVCGIMITFVLAGCGKDQISNEYIKLKSYECVRLDQNDAPKAITEDDIEIYIEQIRESNVEMVEISDKVVESGDAVDIHCVGEIESEEDIMIEQDYTVIVGEETVWDGLGESLLGRKKGETYKFASEFPEDYYDIGFAGKRIMINVEVERVMKPQLPELNDTFVEKVSENSQTIEEYQEEVRQILENGEKETWNLENMIWEELLERTKVKKYPEGRVKKYIAEIIDSYREMATEYEMEYEDFLKDEMDSTPEEFEKYIKHDAQEMLKEELLAEAIAKEEKISLNDEQYEVECEQLAEERGYENVDTLREEFKEEELQKIILKNKVKSWLKKNCQVNT